MVWLCVLYCTVLYCTVWATPYFQPQSFAQVILCSPRFLVIPKFGIFSCGNKSYPLHLSSTKALFSFYIKITGEGQLRMQLKTTERQENNNRTTQRTVVWKRLFYSPLFSRIFIPSLRTRRESRENWTPAQNRRLDRVGGGDRSSRKSHPHPWCFALASLAFSFAYVNREAVNSIWPTLYDEFHR